jgi:hypothetical protein
MNLNGGCFWTSNIMMQRRLFEELKGFDEGFINTGNEDTDMRERLRHGGYAIKFAQDAMVDHPPRVNRVGVAAGRMHESEIRLWYKTGNTSETEISVKVLKSIIYERIQRARRYPFSGDTIKYLGFGVVEFFYTIHHLRQWHAKYRNRFLQLPPPYPYPYK